ncbi:MAG: ATP-dependent Clp protease adaptor ClpS [Planctomycetes bacterium]|nr:ATP-dependent Clp protease adaptor ClpS [Planctomycetota bacterium]
MTDFFLSCYLGSMSEPLKDPFPATSPDTVTVLEVKVKERVAPMMRVVCHDDPYTTMEFVVGILTGVFRLPHARAVEIMLEVHQRGAGVVGLYPLTVAERKVQRATSQARANAFPLTFSIEED